MVVRHLPKVKVPVRFWYPAPESNPTSIINIKLKSANIDAVWYYARYMSAERPLNIGAQLRHNFSRTLESFVPPLREYRVKAEKAKRELELTYTALGGTDGAHVTVEQVRDVLNAELGVLQTSFHFNHEPFYADKSYFKKALKFHTFEGLSTASTFMSIKADQWRDIAYNQEVAESYSEVGNVAETKRRVNGCENASNLMRSMSLKIISPR